MFEVIVLGRAHARGGRPVGQMRVTVRVGPQLRELAVFGDRVWQGAGKERRVGVELREGGQQVAEEETGLRVGDPALSLGPREGVGRFDQEHVGVEPGALVAGPHLRHDPRQ